MTDDYNAAENSAKCYDLAIKMMRQELVAKRTEFLDGRVTLLGGDCLEIVKTLQDATIDSVVCDPPYALVSIVKRFGGANAAPAKGNDAYMRASAGFMGKTWDTGETAFAVEFWAEVIRVLKPGGHVIAASGTRTYHRLAVAIEDAGFEIRDMISWLYGSGFPKSHDVSKGIAKRRVEDVEPMRVVCRFVRGAMDDHGFKSRDLTQFFDDCNPRLIDHWAARDTDSQPALPTAPQWDTLVDVLKLAEREGFEFVAKEWARLTERKGEHSDEWTGAEVIGEVECASPGFGDLRFDGDRSIRKLEDAAAQWAGWGTALKPACEPWVLARKPLIGTIAENVLQHGTGALNIDGCRIEGGERPYIERRNDKELDGYVYGSGINGSRNLGTFTRGRWPANVIHDGSDEVAAGFPCAKAGGNVTGGEPSKPLGGDVFGKGLEQEAWASYADSGSAARFFYSAKADAMDRIGSKHPTVKPVDLMQYLVRLVTPKGGVVLDPFAGTGTTGEAAWREGMHAILIEREAEYQADIERRMDLAASPMMRSNVAATKNQFKGTEDLPLFGGER